MDHKLLDILVCPICKGRLQMNADKTGLICRPDKLVFPIDDGIPVMLESEAKPLDSEATSSTV
ncbi:MAG TPA: Trm112 family protein [Orrella sp.]